MMWQLVIPFAICKIQADFWWYRIWPGDGVQLHIIRHQIFFSNQTQHNVHNVILCMKVEKFNNKEYVHYKHHIIRWTRNAITCFP